MTPSQRKDLQKQLQTLLETLTFKEKRKMEPNRSSDEDSGGDEDAQPLNEMEQTIASNRNRNDAMLVARIESALSRLKASPEDFGLCLQCDEDIPFPRLKAMPYAEYCVECQSKLDGPKSGPTRKKLTDYV